MPALHSCLLAAALALLTQCCRGVDRTCLEDPSLCVNPNSVDVPDVDSLLQVSYRLDAAQDVHADHHTSGDAAFESQGPLNRLIQAAGLLRRAVAELAMSDAKVPFPCAWFPRMCSEPFSCHTLTWRELFGMIEKTVSYDTGNPRSFCLGTTYEPYIATCMAGDLAKAGVIQFNRTLWGFYGSDTMNMDASYCFMEGFCVNDKVTNETTLAEADKLCDERFGHENWTSWTIADQLAIQKEYSSYTVKGKGFHHKAISNAYAKTACAMGNFHCDVMYCKVGFCKDPHFIKMFGHMTPSSQEKAQSYEGPVFVEASSKLT